MAIKLIISDVDGCMSPEISEAWDWSAFARMAELIQAGQQGRSGLAPLTLCTGRPQPYVEALMKLLDVRVPAICENGAVIYSLEKNHARYAPGVTEEKILGLRAVRAFIETQVLPGEPEAYLQFGKEAQLSIYSEQTQRFDAMQRAIEEFIAQRGGPDLLINASHYYLNISLTGVDKGAAIRTVLDELGLSKDEVAGIGDTLGDLPLREAVGFFACPANSHDPIKAVADYVSPHPTIEGMLDILMHKAMQRS